jgi:hypothetical protein
VDHDSIAAHLTRNECEGFKRCCISSEVDETMLICCGLVLKSMGMLGAGVRRMKALTVQMESVTLIGKGR